MTMDMQSIYGEEPMICKQCSTENTASRRFCRECGTGLVSVCTRCGFGNGFDDKFCGGCGQNLSSQPAGAGEVRGSAPDLSGRYSPDDLRDLLQQQAPKPAPAPKKKEGRDTSAVSQDLLDSIFDTPDSD